MELPIEIRTNYFKNRLQDYGECLEALELKTSEKISRVGHQMKGNAITFGFDGLADIGENLENAAFNKDWDKIKIYIEKFGAYLSEQKGFNLSPK